LSSSSNLIGRTVRMPKSERQELILARLGAAPTLRASELASVLAVSTETIRRDLQELDALRLLDRTYGGAVRPLAKEAPIAERHKVLIAEREAIGRAVAARISENEVVMLGAGASTYHVARCLAELNKNIVVVTHDINIATALTANPTIQILFLPGRFHRQDGYVFGSQTIEGLRFFEANWAILGAAGIGPRGVNHSDDEAAAVYRAMTLRAAKAIIVADSTKFGMPALSVFAEWNEIDGLFTDAEPGRAFSKALSEAEVEVVVAETKLRR
jgi:DeoR/GlpR family transcriptional regulator of sugar metabolism